MTDQKRISRRQLLQGALIGGAGLATAAVVGCDDSNDNSATPGSSTSQTPTPGVITTTPQPTLAAPRWGRLPQGATTPPPRRDHSLVTDGQRLYVFGGRGADTLGDFWTYNLSSAQWTEITAAGPQPRFGHNAGYDVAGSNVSVFGGQSSGFFNDLWTYTPTTGTWQQSPSSGGPSPRYGAASTIDTSGRLVVSHGFTDSGRFDDTWAYGSGAWGDVSPAGGPRPIERCLTRGVLDATTSAFILFGGQTDSNPFLGDTWKLVDTGWEEITPEKSPPPRNLFSMVWDDERGRALAFGGQTEDGRTNDVWVFDPVATSWSQLPTQGEAPSPRSGHDAVWLPGRRAMLVFGGQDDSGDESDLWELAFSG